jgi:hypothetical protein
MCAAALGNIVSDLCGVPAGNYIEALADKMKIPRAHITPAQDALPAVRHARHTGIGLGLLVGCILGMCPLLFMEADKSLKLKAKARLNAAFAAVMHEVTEILDCDRAALYLVDEATGETWTRVGKGGAPAAAQGSLSLFTKQFTDNDSNFGNAGEEFGDLKTIRFPRGEGITGHVVKSGRTLNEGDPYSSPHFVGARDKTQKYKTKSILSSPIFNRNGEVIGAITVVNKNSEGGFTKADEYRLQAINSHISIAIEEALMPVETSISEEFGKVDLAQNICKMKLYFPDALPPVVPPKADLRHKVGTVVKAQTAQIAASTE